MDQDHIPIFGTASIGRFSIDERTAAACFDLRIDVPVGVRGIEPVLTLAYNSRGHGAQVAWLPKGWELNGFPVMTRISGCRFLVGDKIVTAKHDSSGALVQYDEDGVRTVYLPIDGNSRDTYRISRLVDCFENEIRFSYHPGGAPKSILYGCQAQLNRSIHFTYNAQDNRLVRISTYVNERSALQYDLQGNNDALDAIQLFSFVAERSAALPPLQFRYDSSEQALLSAIENVSGGQTRIDYRVGKSGVVSSYQLRIKGPFGKTSNYNWDVTAEGEFPNRFERRQFQYVAIWSQADQNGRYWYFVQNGLQAGLMRAKGILALVGDKPSVCKAQEIRYHYKWNKGAGDFLVVKEAQRNWISETERLPDVTRYFEYDGEGALVIQKDGSRIVTRSYIRGPGQGNPRFLARATLRNTAETSIDTEGLILRDDLFSHQFDTKNGRLQSICHQSLIDLDRYSNPVVSELNRKGLVHRLTQANGSIVSMSYDEFSLVRTELFSSPNGTCVQRAEKCHDPVFGALIYEKTLDGAVSQIELDAFGHVQVVKGYDLNDPESWQSGDKLIPVQTNKTAWDDAFAAIVTTERCVGGGTADSDWICLTVRDSLYRPVVVLNQIEARRWQVQLFRYRSSSVSSAQSLPFNMNCKQENLAAVLRKKAKSKINWIIQKYDAFGRNSGVDYPDGSKTEVTYELQNLETLVTRTVSLASDGAYAGDRLDSLEIDGCRRTVLSGDSGLTETHYDLMGQLIRKIGPAGEETRYQWNGLGHCISEENNVTGLSLWEFGPDMQMVSVQRANGRTKFSYDWRGRLIEKLHKSQGKDEVSYQFKYKNDPENCSQSVTAYHPEGGYIQLRHAPNGEIISRNVTLDANITESITNALYSDGSVRCRYYPDGRNVEFSYNGLGWLTSARWQGVQSAIAEFDGHDLFGRSHRTRFENGIIEYRTSNSLGQVTAFQVESGKRQQLLSQQLSYDHGFPGLVSVMHQKSDAANDVFKQFSYDQFARLSHVQNMDGEMIEAYSHPVGICQMDAQADRNGRLLSATYGKSEWKFEFDADDRLKECCYEEGGVSGRAVYEHDALGDKLLRIDGVGNLTFFIDQDYQITRTANGNLLATIKICSEFGTVAEMTAPCISALHTFEPVEAFADNIVLERDAIETNLEFIQRKEGNIFLHLDGQGSTILATEETGRVVARLGFDSFGNIDPRQSTGKCGFDMVFARMQYDPAVRLYDAGERYYCPEICQFLTPDPARSSTDLYAYPSDPVNNFDDKGLCGRSNYLQAFRAEYGRSPTIIGAGSFAVLSSIGVYAAWDMLVFGYDAGKAVRWGLAIAVWFGALAVLPRLFDRENDRQRRWQRGCGPIGSSLVKIGISASVGAMLLGPVIAFIGNDDCGPWNIFDCSQDHYRMSTIRGVIASGMSSFLSGLLRNGFARYSCSGNSLCARYGTGLISLWLGFITWHVVDYSVQRFGFDVDGYDIIQGKMSFATGEIPLGILMATPNPIWGLLPVLLGGGRCGCLMDVLFGPRIIFGTDHPHHGEPVPILPRRYNNQLPDPVQSGPAIQIIVIEGEDGAVDDEHSIGGEDGIVNDEHSQSIAIISMTTEDENDG